LTASELIRILGRAGWEVVRHRGSHWRLENPDRPRDAVTVAVHAHRDLPEGTLRAILRRAGLSREEFEALKRG
jgi:predicted RNA binding protein YcfA (HicA-like mRNA interferase family)